MYYNPRKNIILKSEFQRLLRDTMGEGKQIISLIIKMLALILLVICSSCFYRGFFVFFFFLFISKRFVVKYKTDGCTICSTKLVILLRMKFLFFRQCDWQWNPNIFCMFELDVIVRNTIERSICSIMLGLCTNFKFISCHC